MTRFPARPVHVAHDRGRITVQCYRGYGSREEIFLMGRVFKQSRSGEQRRRGVLWRDLVDIGRLLLRRGIGDATVRARFGETCQAVTTDSNGYFRVHTRLVQPLPDRLWHGRP